MKDHYYKTIVTWTGNTGKGTLDYKAYERDHIIQVQGKPEIQGTSEVSYYGNQFRYNPEELLVASLSACHMLWFLHLCAINKVVIIAYKDIAFGTMQTTPGGGGKFTEVILKPDISIAGSADAELLDKLHKEANTLCFIASSCNFPVRHQPNYIFK